MASSAVEPTNRLTRRWVRSPILIAALLSVLLAPGSGQARSRGIPRGSLGINIRVFNASTFYPSDLAMASRAGVSMARVGVDEGTDMDATVTALALAHMRLYPDLGLPCPSGGLISCPFDTEIPPATAASEMAQYVTTFAQRYGPHGSFWSSHPTLPYEPVKAYEIGNEPNIRTIWIEDVTHLHWTSPTNSLLADYGDYAQVYEAARTALHKVDPSGVAVVGGLADSASFGTDTLTVEAQIAALPRGGVDAVAYHPWVYDVNDGLLGPDTADVRVWMNHHGFAHVPLQVNEFGACGQPSASGENQSCPRLHSSAQWGRSAAAYTRWALCTRWLGVQNLQPFVWGDTPTSDQSMWLPLVASSGAVTPYGQDFLAAAKRLSRRGCGRHARGQAPSGPRRVTVRGRTVVGHRLTGHPGRWQGTPRPRLYYQWERCAANGAGCTMIGGANRGRYTLAPEDSGSTLRLLVTAINPTGGATATSAATAKVDR